MMSSLIILLEMGLCALLLLLAFRVLSLTRSEPPLHQAMHSEAANTHESFPRNPSPRAGSVKPKGQAAPPQSLNQHPDKCELITQLHILGGLQVRDCKKQGLDIEAAHLAVREYTVCWLYGAVCALSSPSARDPEALTRLVSQFAARKAGIRQSEAVTVISTLTRSSAFLACFRSGIDGAEFWKTHHFVPADQSLFEAVTSNAFV